MIELNLLEEAREAIKDGNYKQADRLIRAAIVLLDGDKEG